MVYLRKLTLPSELAENRFLISLKRTCYNGVYPYKIFTMKGLEEVSFAPITIFSGGNGSGKTTLLNIIATGLDLARHSEYNDSPFFENFIKSCYYFQYCKQKVFCINS